MRATEDWRSTRFDDQFAGFERPDFAQEFLRRNPKYQLQFEQAEDDPQALKEVAARWGLCFRD